MKEESDSRRSDYENRMRGGLSKGGFESPIPRMSEIVDLMARHKILATLVTVGALAIAVLPDACNNPHHPKNRPAGISSEAPSTNSAGSETASLPEEQPSSEEEIEKVIKAFTKEK